ncbi:MAG: TIGR00730 family Rossman fold protein [Candidatus Paceibacterota bacterium]|jgi:hypothetical protein
MIQRLWRKDWKGDTPLSFKELHRAANMRMSQINREFRETFEFLEDYPRSVTFFGSTRFTEDHPCYVQARRLAGRIAKETGYTVVTGGGPGVMEAANRGAYEAGGKSVGMHIHLPKEQKENAFLTASRKFYYFFVRKVALSFSAEVYVFFPGGFGTLDEFFEIVTLVQTAKIPRVPIVCVGHDYWNDVKKGVMLLRDKYKTITPGDEDLFKIVDTDDEVIDIIKNAPLRRE